MDRLQAHQARLSYLSSQPPGLRSLRPLFHRQNLVHRRPVVRPRAGLRAGLHLVGLHLVGLHLAALDLVVEAAVPAAPALALAAPAAVQTIRASARTSSRRQPWAP